MVIEFTSSLTGVPMAARLVRKGETYGLNHCLTHDDDDDPLVEFYDLRHEHDVVGPGIEGQFIARYYLSTLSEGPFRPGLDLNMGVPNWKVGPEVNQIVDTLRRAAKYRDNDEVRAVVEAVPRPTLDQVRSASAWYQSRDVVTRCEVGNQLHDVFGPNWALLELAKYHLAHVGNGWALP